VDVNGDGATGALGGFDDWANLKLDFQSTGDFEDGAHTTGPIQELDVPTYMHSVAPDPALAMTASPSTVLTGSNVTYTIMLSNARPSAATGVVVTDVLPATTTFVSCSATGGGVCGGSGSNRTVTFATLRGATTETITIVANVNCPVANGATINNSASLVSATPDPDTSNDSASATVTTSNPPPVIGPVSVDKPVLWPPNHDMIPVTVNYTVSDNCGTPVCVLTVTSNEAVNGPGSKSPDWTVTDAHHVTLRAERDGSGSGRVYTITTTCADSANNSSMKTAIVSVPHDQR
jgi:uncharacterized repeat protein (TIGR01451 family)